MVELPFFFSFFLSLFFFFCVPRRKDSIVISVRQSTAPLIISKTIFEDDWNWNWYSVISYRMLDDDFDTRYLGDETVFFLSFSFRGVFLGFRFLGKEALVITK